MNCGLFHQISFEMKFPAIWIVKYSDGDGESYLCVCIFEIFDELWTLSSIKFRAIWILEYSDRDGESFLLVRMYSRNLRSTVESFIKFLSKWNFVLFESLNIRMEMENLPYLCVYNTRIFFDLRSTVDSFVHQISYLNLRIFGWRWRIFLTCAYVIRV